MNKKIEFKKDCIMKSMVSEITDISLTHDYKILDDVIDGYFDVSGEYKVTKASLQKEEFMYTIPFSIAISSLIDRNTINLTIDDFDYSFEKDVIHLKMTLNLDYEEIKEEIKENEEAITTQDDESSEDILESVDDILESIPDIDDDNNEFHNELMLDKEDNMEEMDKNEENVLEKEEAQESIMNVISNMKDEGFYKYKVYIMREEDTIESVAIKYNVTLDVIKEYNDLEDIKVGSKIVIPFINNDDEDK